MAIKKERDHVAWIIDAEAVGTPHGACFCLFPTTAPRKRQSGTPVRTMHQAMLLHLLPAGLQYRAGTSSPTARQECYP